MERKAALTNSTVRQRRSVSWSRLKDSEVNGGDELRCLDAFSVGLEANGKWSEQTTELLAESMPAPGEGVRGSRRLVDEINPKIALGQPTPAPAMSETPRHQAAVTQPPLGRNQEDGGVTGGDKRNTKKTGKRGEKRKDVRVGGGKNRLGERGTMGRWEELKEGRGTKKDKGLLVEHTAC